MMMKTTRTICGVLLCALLCACTTESACRIGVSQCSDDEWRQQMNAEILREAILYDGAKVEIVSCHDDTRRQIDDIRALVERGVDALIISPNEAEALSAVITEAYATGIPVVIVDRKVYTDNYTAWVGADNYDAGYEIGRYAAARLGGRGRILEITGLASSSSAIERRDGFRAALRPYEAIEVVAQADAGWFEEEARIRTDSLLRRYDDIDLIFAHCDRMAVGAYRAAKELGREREILFVGIDAMSNETGGVRQVTDGVLDATLFYPTGGDIALQTAMAALRGGQPPRTHPLKSFLVTAENAPVMLLQNEYIEALDAKIGALDRRAESIWARLRVQRILTVVALAALAAVAASGVVLYRMYRSKRRMNSRLEAQKSELERQRDHVVEISRQLEEATNAKLVFFTNISHDFRTPLTLITGPVESLLAGSEPLSAGQRRLLEIVRRNGAVLLNLIDQILDFRKYENGKATLMLSDICPAEAIAGWNGAFAEEASNRRIAFTFENRAGERRMTADAAKLQRIYFNLLSNAFKYTPDGGRITVTLDAGDRGFGLTVADTGRGIPPSRIDRIFDRFYTVADGSPGTGIGLALVKAFVEMHGGRIEVTSSEGAGSRFRVELPFRAGASGAGPAADDDAVEDRTAATVAKSLSTVGAPTEEELLCEERPVLLVVDDNDGIREYVRRLFGDSWRVLEAEDGRRGVELATECLPDLIVSDVMMPVMDGIEMCGILKEAPQTCHIPILMLTACALDEQRIAGLRSGADAYMAKPFNFRVLKAQADSLVANARRRAERATCPGEQPETPPGEELSETDRKFLAAFDALIRERMDDPECRTEELGRTLGFSRVQLYRKVKQLTGSGVNEYLRHARLTQARTLLRTTDRSVKEIAYECGFTSNSYFTKCYREEFGQTPAEARDTARQGQPLRL